MFSYTPVYAQTNPGFVDGLTLCATVTSVYCQGNPPSNSLGLNTAFSRKMDYPSSSSPGLFSLSVGIGPRFSSTSAIPDSLLEVNANTAATPGSLPAGTVLHIVGASSATTRVLVDGFSGSANFSGRAAVGSPSAPSSLALNGAIATFAALGYGTTGYSSTARASISAFAAENWTDTAQGTYLTFNTNATGAASLTERMRIDSTGFVNIGPALTPDSLLTVNSNTANTPGVLASNTVLHIVGITSIAPRLLIDGFSSGGIVTGRRAQGTILSPTAPTVGQALLSLNAYGYGTTGYVATQSSQITFNAAETFSDTAYGSNIIFLTTAIGGGSPTITQRMEIFASGGVSIGNTTDPGAANLSVTGAISSAGLPTSAGGGGVNVCVDTGGVFYKKASCP